MTGRAVYDFRAFLLRDSTFKKKINLKVKEGKINKKQGGKRQNMTSNFKVGNEGNKHANISLTTFTHYYHIIHTTLPLIC